MKKLVILGLVGLMGLPMAVEAQRRPTTPPRNQPNNAAAQAEQERQRQADLERQQQEQQQNAAALQLQQTSAAAHPSARPVPPSDILYKKTVWRTIDLREKQNLPMFSTGKQITKLIVEAVKRNELQAYLSDSLTTPISAKTFVANLTPPSNIIGPQPVVPGGGAAPNRATRVIQRRNDWGDLENVTVYVDTGEEVPDSAVPAGGGAPAGGGGTDGGAGELFASQLYRLELKEDVVFDKKRSRLYHDPQALTLIMPAKFTGALGFEKVIASFKFSDLVKLFRAHPEEAIWFNAQNDAQHKNLADAFDLWLFSSYITKVSNPNDNRLGDGRNGLLAAQQAMEELIEWEYSLWSY